MPAPAIPLIYVGDYTAVGSVAGGTLSAPEWASDSFSLTTDGITVGQTTFAGYVTPPGGRVGSFYYGDDQGRIFQEDESAEVPFIGVSSIVPAHVFFGDAGGDVDEGKKLTRWWSYLRSEDSAWIARLWPGSEFAYVPDGSLNQPIGGLPAGFSNYAVPGVIDNVVATRSEELEEYGGISDRLVRRQPITVHSHDTSGVPNSGRGFTVEYLLVDPIDGLFLGWGGVWEPGSTGRPVSRVSSPDE